MFFMQKIKEFIKGVSIVERRHQEGLADPSLMLYYGTGISYTVYPDEEDHTLPPDIKDINEEKFLVHTN